MDLGLRGKVAIVTGGGQNIGRGISLAFAKEGTNVVIAQRTKSVAEKAAAECQGLGVEAAALVTDITDEDQVQTLVKSTLDKFKRVDILVNNAVVVGMDKFFVEATKSDWEPETKVGFWGTIHCAKAVLPHMIEQRSGRIINIGSDAGRIGEYKEAIHSGCKAAVTALTKSIAKEVGRYGITANIVCPALTPPTINVEELPEGSVWRQLAHFWTPENLAKAVKRYPMGRLTTPEDVGNLVVFLASDAASFITGQTISVNGGYTMI
jgi:2-hydroxycyclohexanecarboxyl-CoA dehydrogenase